MIDEINEEERKIKDANRKRQENIIFWISF